MQHIVFIFLFVIAPSAFAFSAKVVEFVPGEESFVKLDNGEVVFLDGQKSMFKVGDVVETANEGRALQDSNYTPDVLKNMNAAVDIFENFRSGAKRRSQCYNRAHIWSYEEHQRRGTKLMKTFIFFTNSYIRNYRYKWWFHVSPSTFVEENGEQKEFVLDWAYFDVPQEVKAWTDFFIHSKRSCPVVTKYSDYENNQQTEDCYLIKTSMYFWQPLDIEAYEQTGAEKTSFHEDEVKRAYRQAF